MHPDTYLFNVTLCKDCVKFITIWRTVNKGQCRRNLQGATLIRRKYS